ncbi:MAG: tRNA (adenosine(37)-N6)-threonylcarbamoyltransferase complex ATPase subunit type 1 TsaE [Planctomycetia bacterium]|nr:tRNA (adenosine(37)-N6)-threonylcarbamoyltransferase complex ATPase subunit type 1 TsaE [Planctomycetia bacterium]
MTQQWKVELERLRDGDAVVWETELHTPDAMDQLGQALESVLPAGTVVALHGTLGAGKTRLVQAVAQATGIPAENVTSPTFVLIQEYLQGRRPLYHFDVYRLKDEAEFWELGPEEYFDSDGLTFIEWAQKVEACLPESYWEIFLTQTGEYSRHVQIRLAGRVPSNP